MSKYGFNENEIVATKTVQIDKDGFHRIIDGENDKKELIVNGSFFLTRDTWPNICKYALSISDSNKPVYTTFETYDEEINQSICYVIAFTSDIIETQQTGNDLMVYMHGHNIPYVLSDYTDISYGTRIESSQISLSINSERVIPYSEPEVTYVPNIAICLAANKNDYTQIFKITANDGNFNDSTVERIGNFNWPFEHLINYNPFGEFKVTVRNDVDIPDNGILLGLEGFAGKGEIWVSHVDYRQNLPNFIDMETDWISPSSTISGSNVPHTNCVFDPMIGCLFVDYESLTARGMNLVSGDTNTIYVYIIGRGDTGNVLIDSAEVTFEYSE